MASAMGASRVKPWNSLTNPMRLPFRSSGMGEKSRLLPRTLLESLGS